MDLGAGQKDEGLMCKDQGLEMAVEVVTIIRGGLHPHRHIYVGHPTLGVLQAAEVMGAPRGEEINKQAGKQHTETSGMWEGACVCLGEKVSGYLQVGNTGTEHTQDTAALESLRSHPGLTLASSLANAQDDTTVL